MEDLRIDGKTTADVLQMLILGLICTMAFMIRLFAVVRYESVIHEFDPYFNYRTTDYLVREGADEFRNWCGQMNGRIPLAFFARSHSVGRIRSVCGCAVSPCRRALRRRCMMLQV